jgi:hypothetical protein
MTPAIANAKAASQPSSLEKLSSSLSSSVYEDTNVMKATSYRNFPFEYGDLAPHHTLRGTSQNALKIYHFATQ